MKNRILAVFFVLALASLACMGSIPNTNNPEYQYAIMTQQVHDLQLTQMAAGAGLVNAQSTAVINNSSDSPQGGVNIYLQGHEDGYSEGVEDVNATNTIDRQGNSIAFWQIAAGALLVFILGMVFLNAVSKS